MIGVVFIAYHGFVVVVIVWDHPLVLLSSDDGNDVLEPASGIYSRIDKPRRPFVVWCVGHAEMIWSAVCLCAPHSQVQEEPKPYLYKDDQKRPIPVCKRLNLTYTGPDQEAWNQLVTNFVRESQRTS